VISADDDANWVLYIPFAYLQFVLYKWNGMLQVQELVADQTKEWTDMVMRQMADEHEMLKAHVGQLTELLRELMEDAQDLQMKELELRHEKYVLTIWTCENIIQQVFGIEDQNRGAHSDLQKWNNW